jgi:hypothetical protein
MAAGDWFKIRVTAKDESRRLPTKEAPPTLFWKSIEDPLSGEIDNAFVRRAEAYLHTHFGTNLKSVLVNGLVESRMVLSTTEKRSFEFRISSLSYETLDLSVLIAGLPMLVDFFDNNFDLFKMALDNYVPIAFDKTIRTGKLRLENVDFEITFSDNITKVFSEKSSAQHETSVTKTQGGSLQRSERFQWLWLASNTSLIIPVILIIVVFYSAIRDMRATRDLSFQLMNTIASEIATIRDARSPMGNSPPAGRSSE